MKNLFFLLMAVFSALISPSCSKQSGNELIVPAVSTNIIEARISPNQSFQLNLNSVSGSIVKQALHFLVSKTELDEKIGSMVYEYVPALDYVGTDEIVISKSQAVNNGNAGCQNNHNNNNARTSNILTTIRITIAN
jgi:hypothetical protein